MLVGLKAHRGVKDHGTLKEDDVLPRDGKIVHHDRLLDGVDREVLQDCAGLVHDPKAEEWRPHELIPKVQHVTCMAITDIELQLGPRAEEGCPHELIPRLQHVTCTANTTLALQIPDLRSGACGCGSDPHPQCDTRQRTPDW